MKDELLKLLVEARDDFNFCRFGIGEALKDFATPEDVPKIVSFSDWITENGSPNEDNDGFAAGAATTLGKMDLDVIRKAFLPKDPREKPSRIRAEILCDILWDRRSTAALNLGADLLERGVERAATAISFICEYAKREEYLDWSGFSSVHVDQLVRTLDGEGEEWTLKSIEHLCAARPDLAERVRTHASMRSGIRRAVLLWCLNGRDTTTVFDALEYLENMNQAQRRSEPVHLVNQVDLTWRGHEALYVRLLRLRDVRIARALLGDGIPVELDIGDLEIGEPGWWLEWLSDEEETHPDFWFREQMGSLFGSQLTADVRQSFVAELNKSQSRFRRLLARSILPYFTDLSSDMFTEEAISFLIADLTNSGSYGGLRGHVLSTTATELLVTERLLPLVRDAKSPLAENLERVLRDAGARHGRRYIPS